MGCLKRRISEKNVKLCGFKGKTLESPFEPFIEKRTFLPLRCSKTLHDFEFVDETSVTVTGREILLTDTCHACMDDGKYVNN